MKKTIIFISAMLAAAAMFASCNNSDPKDDGGSTGGQDETTYGSYGIGSDTEIINQAFYLVYEDTHPTEYALYFYTDENFQFGVDGDTPETSFAIGIDEQYFGTEIALDNPEVIERLMLSFNLFANGNHYSYHAHNQAGEVEIQAYVKGNINEDNLGVNGSFKVTKDGDKFTVAIDAKIGNYNLVCTYSGKPVLVVPAEN